VLVAGRGIERGRGERVRERKRKKIEGVRYHREERRRHENF
jgi:hypothetical protein